MNAAKSTGSVAAETAVRRNDAVAAAAPACNGVPSLRSPEPDA